MTPYVLAAPELMSSAATDLGRIGSELDAAHLVASPSTTALIPAAADEVSAGITKLFSSYANDFHALAAKAAAFQGQFVDNLKASGAAYTAADTAPVPWLDGWKATLEWGLNTTEANLIHDFGPLVQNLVNDIVGPLLAVVVLGGIVVFFIVSVPIGVVGQVVQYYAQWLGSLLP